MSKFTVACVQICAGNDLQANLARSSELIYEAANSGAELICLPEFYCLLCSADESYFAQSYEESDHPALEHGRFAAQKSGCWLLLGSIPVRSAESGRVFNRSYVLAPDGHVAARYDKLHLFDVAIGDGQPYQESKGVVPGSSAAIASLPWGALGLSICYDLRFPQLYRTLAQAGAHFLAVPAAFTAKTGAAHWHTLLRARAIETGCFVFAPAQSGERPWGRKTYGHSLIVDPWGEILGDAGEDEGIILAEIEPQRVESVRRMIPSLRHDRPIRVS
ncbi:MAG: carbon-nitrogen hydrolase family protein [Gammaproteobacteria bacterium]